MSNTAFGPWLASELMARDMSQAELARRLEASNGTVSSWVNNKRRPTPSSCRRVAAILHVPMDVALAAAGHRPLDAKDWPDGVVEVAEMMAGLPEREQQEVIEFVRWRVERSDRHG